MEYPISIIIPCSPEYKTRYLKECLDSIPNGVEVIIIDMIFGVDRWVDKLNEGINLAKNEWVLPLGIDDKLYPGAINELVRNIDTSDVYFGQLKTFGNSDNLLDPIHSPKESDFNINNQIYFTSMFRKSKALEIGGYYAPDDKPFYEDWDFWFRLLKSGAKFKYINYPIFYYRDHENQSWKKMQKDFEILREKVIKHVYENSSMYN